MPDPIEQALALLPHGPEFRFLDRLVSLVPGQEGAGEYRLRGDEPFLRGHFPDSPLMPGVLLLEAAAQLAGVVAQSDPQFPPLAGLKLAAVRQARILNSVSPGQTILVAARVTARLGGLIQAQTRVSAEDGLLLTAEITLSGQPPAAPPPRV